jgi:integrase
VARKRRGRGEGAIYYNERRKEWCASASFGIDPETGKRQRRTIYARSKKEAEQRLADLKARTGTELARRRAPTLKEFVAEWLEIDVRKRRRPTTYHVYENVTRRHVIPYLGKVRMNAATPQDIQRCVAIVEEMSGTAMAGKVRVILHRIFRRAVAKEVAFRNPVSAIEAPQHTPAPKRFLDARQVKALFHAARGDRLEALVVLLATSGMRLGEALALCWSDVSFAKRTVRIERTAVEINGPIHFAPPKSKAGVRTIAVGALALDAMKTRKEAAQDEGYAAASNLIFPTTIGTAWRKTNLHRRWWRPLLKKAKLEHLRIHDLRHTAASLSLAAGTNARTVADRLGHEDAATTQRVYQHVVERLHRADAAALDAMLRPTRRKTRQRKE